MKKNLRASVTKLAWNGIVDEINKVNNEIRELENGPRDKEGGREKLLGCRKRRARLGKKAKEVKKTYNHFQRYLNSDFWEITEEEAVRLIVEKTHGCDETGRPNSLHPLTVGSRGTTKDERITGYLHDLVEDTSVTWEDLEKHFVPKRIIEALKLLTHDKTKPYEKYIQGIIDSGNELALITKARDLEHNIQRDDSVKNPERVRKHVAALNRLLPLIGNGA